MSKKFIIYFSLMYIEKCSLFHQVYNAPVWGTEASDRSLGWAGLSSYFRWSLRPLVSSTQAYIPCIPLPNDPKLLITICLVIHHASWHGILGSAFNSFLSVADISSGFFPKSDLQPLSRRFQLHTRDWIPRLYMDGCVAWHCFCKGLLLLVLASIWG